MQTSKEKAYLKSLSKTTQAAGFSSKTNFASLFTLGSPKGTLLHSTLFSGFDFSFAKESVFSLQVRTLFLQWLPWILRMQRPGKPITRKTIMMTNRMRELELKEKSSKSLLANVLDMDDDFRWVTTDKRIHSVLFYPKMRALRFPARTIAYVGFWLFLVLIAHCANAPRKVPAGRWHQSLVSFCKSTPENGNWDRKVFRMTDIGTAQKLNF